jgi:hypothetical protein
MKLPPIINLFEVTADLRSGLRGRRRTYHTILERAWSANFKMIWYVVLGYRKLSLSIIDNFAIFLIIELSIISAKIIDNSR